MKNIHLGAAALNLTPKDWEGNLVLIQRAIEEAKKRKISLLCFPELTITGYGCEDEFHAPYVSEWALEILFEKVAPLAKNIVIAVGLPLSFNGCVYNTTAIVGGSKVRGFIAKQNLAGDGIHYEPRFFKPWPTGLAETICVKDQDIPIGDILFDFEGIRVGLEICEDAWVANRPGNPLSRQAIDVILNPSASHFSFQKSNIRKRFAQEGSRAFQCAYVYANLLGNEAGRAIYDGNSLIATEGQVIAESQPFAYEDYTLIDAVIDVEHNRTIRNRLASYKPERETPKTIVDIPISIESSQAVSNNVTALSDFSKQEEFHHAVCLSLFDYMRKSRTNGFALSLSGGADSAACLTLIYILANTLRKQCPDHPYIIKLFERSIAEMTPQQIMHKLCFCAYQKTENSSTDTETAASEIAKATGAQFASIDIQPVVDAYEGILADAIKRPLNWKQDDLTRQNIQARTRAPSIWGIANAHNFLLISTSNRSEAAVGYCTMDGDTAGSISPIAGVDKAFLCEWLKWAEAKHLPELKAVNKLQPTAELRPLGTNQTDEKDLMPYPILNDIQKLAVIKKMSPRDIYFALEKKLFQQPTDKNRKQLFEWLQRYFTLWSRNQWKRERYAPSFHLDDENLDPRSWCRYPILSNSYSSELKALEKELKL